MARVKPIFRATGGFARLQSVTPAGRVRPPPGDVRGFPCRLTRRQDKRGGVAIM